MPAYTLFQSVPGATIAEWLFAHLPPGKAIHIDDLGLDGALQALGLEFSRVQDFLVAVLEELDVETTTELVDAWEDALGLPDPCDPSPPTTIADRRLALHAKLTGRYGMQLEIVNALIEALGYTGVEVQLPILFRVDESAVDERLYDHDWVYVWFVWRATAPPQGWTRLLCRLQTGGAPVAHSHTLVVAIDGLRANEVTTPT